MKNRLINIFYCLDRLPVPLSVLFLCIVLAFSNGEAAESDYFSSVQGQMYKNKTFKQATTSFTPYDKMYITAYFHDIEAGKYILITDWITPWNNLEHQNRHTFEITRLTPSYKVFSWLSLWKNGPFKRMVSGEEFKKEFYGSWQVILYLNGKQVLRRTFEVQ